MTTSTEAIAQIARAVLYEGYILWPYRRSAIKNQQRWTFGGIYPREYAAQSGGADRSAIRADVLFEPTKPDARMDVSLRFLRIVVRQALEVGTNGLMTPTTDLVVDDRRVLSWDEATEREVSATIAVNALEETRIAIRMPPGRDQELLRRDDGSVAGAIVRRWAAIDAVMTISLSALEVDDRGEWRSLRRITVTVENSATWKGSATERENALRRTLVSAHIVLHSDDGNFVSTEDPPSDLCAATKELGNDGVWPTLVGERGGRHTLLATPIILGDYPHIAPESSGDFFDGGEIDQLLVLNVLALTEEEQSEMEATDPRAREILQRCRTLGPAAAMRLHATMRPERFAEPAPLNLISGERA